MKLPAAAVSAASLTFYAWLVWWSSLSVKHISQRTPERHFAYLTIALLYGVSLPWWLMPLLGWLER